MTPVHEATSLHRVYVRFTVGAAKPHLSLGMVDSVSRPSSEHFSLRLHGRLRKIGIALLPRQFRSFWLFETKQC